MKKVIKGTLALITGAGMLGLSGVTASANSQYSATRSRSVKLVWRKSMHRHALTATQGARYSKHLGLRYGQNAVTASVTWYTDAHEKLYRKAQGRSAIYYHVKNADGTLQGWIWRGYLKSATGATTPDSKGNPSASQPTNDEQVVLSLGHGAKPNAAAMALAKRVLAQVTSGQYKFQTMAEIDFANSNFKNDDSVVRDGIDTRNPTTAETKQWAKFMSANGIGTFGMGPGKAQTTLLIEDHLFSEIKPTFSAFYSPSTEYYGQQGLNAKNFYSEVKIGLATGTMPNGQQAMFAIFEYPAKYSKLTFND